MTKFEEAIQAAKASRVRETPHFSGRTYDEDLDHDRLAGQLGRVKDYMFGLPPDEWRTLFEISEATGDLSVAAISARLRDLRKERFGSYTVQRRRRGEPRQGLFEYRVLKPTK